MKKYKVPRLGTYESCIEHGSLAHLDFFNNHSTRHTVVQQILDSRQNVDTRPQRRKLPCPICRNQVMKVTSFQAQPEGFYIDQCFKCNSIWFDADEMKKLFFGPHVERKKISPSEFPFLLNAEEFASNTMHLNPFYLLGFPIKGDEVQTNYRQLTAYLLMFAIVFLSWKGFRDAEFFEKWMLIPGDFKRQYFSTLITSIFLHADWMHLISNVYFLFLCAENIEEKKGPLFVFELFFLSGIAGSVAYILSGSSNPTIGASGAVSGLLVYFAFQFPHARFYSKMMHWRLFAVITRNQSVGLYLFLWLIVQLSGIAFGEPGVNYWAHLGGAAMGLFFYLAHELSSSRKASK